MKIINNFVKTDEDLKLIDDGKFFFGVFATCYAFAVTFLFLSLFIFNFPFKGVAMMSLGVGLWAYYNSSQANKKLLQNH